MCKEPSDKKFGCFMGNCKQLYDPNDPCEDIETRAGKWGKCHEFVPFAKTPMTEPSDSLHADSLQAQIEGLFREKKYLLDKLVRMNKLWTPKEKCVPKSEIQKILDDYRPMGMTLHEKSCNHIRYLREALEELLNE